MNDISMDQQLLTSIYVQKQYKVDIDWKCEIFHNLHFKDFITRRADLKDLKFIENRVLNTASGSKPCIIHASGNTSMKELGLRLGYNKKILIPKNNMLNFTKKASFHISQILKSHSRVEK
jgi:hypothetical protein